MNTDTPIRFEVSIGRDDADLPAFEVYHLSRLDAARELRDFRSKLTYIERDRTAPTPSYYIEQL